MKKIFIAPIVILFFLGFSSCGGDEPEPSIQEQTQELLVGTGSTPKTWKIQSVTVDGVDRTSMFTGLTIQFGSGTMTVTNGGLVLPATGSWTFSTAEAKAIKLGNGMEIQLDVTEASLTLTLTWAKTTFGPGRVGSISGKHVFMFVL